MAAIPGSIRVTGFIAPTDSTDTYACTDPIYGIDGLRSVADLTERNAISNERRREGMLAYTQSDSSYWTLLPSPWSGTNADWTPFGSTVNSYITTFANGDLIADQLSVTHALGTQYNQVVIYDNNNLVVIPTEISATSTTVATVDLSGIAPITGTWRAVVIKGG